MSEEAFLIVFILVFAYVGVYSTLRYLDPESFNKSVETKIIYVDRYIYIKEPNVPEKQNKNDEIDDLKEKLNNEN